MVMISSAIGGYLAGRLRTKWTGVHSDEVYFRDTAHGFLAWAFASVLARCLAGVTGNVSHWRSHCVQTMTAAHFKTRSPRSVASKSRTIAQAHPYVVAANSNPVTARWRGTIYGH